MLKKTHTERWMSAFGTARTLRKLVEKVKKRKRKKKERIMSARTKIMTTQPSSKDRLDRCEFTLGH